MLALSSYPHTDVSRPIVVPVVPHRGMIDPAIDRILTDLARSRHVDEAEVRNALFIAYAPRLRRILMRLWYRSLSEFGCELDDLKQELYVIFATLLERWSENGSFSAYIHGALPWRLFDAARRLAPRDRPLDDRPVTALNQDDSYEAGEAAVLLEKLAATLSPFDRDLLLRRVRDGQSMTTIARAHGMNHRTVRRAWLRLQQHLRAALTIS
ncbi:MAG TPA: sigma-70 family RNA polymerase sigma factor [Thermomicrobiales bacterium]|nr:sigma-70 family RNA polymerase sigma factor [Thermomicrobiales bacterium]